ncbi:MAG: hypothetical protein JWQ75_489 [Pseudarthrobacter sp.]|nr:hypothetical protein [Pseudarthrobacter sp.]
MQALPTCGLMPDRTIAVNRRRSQADRILGDPLTRAKAVAVILNSGCVGSIPGPLVPVPPPAGAGCCFHGHAGRPFRQLRGPCVIPKRPCRNGSFTPRPAWTYRSMSSNRTPRTSRAAAWYRRRRWKASGSLPLVRRGPGPRTPRTSLATAGWALAPNSLVLISCYTEDLGAGTWWWSHRRFRPLTAGRSAAARRR